MINQNAGFEKPNKIETEKESMTKIFRNTEAPLENKNNPFFRWGTWRNGELYLPESSEAVSFSIAAHELGHLIDADRVYPKNSDFEGYYQEESRAWEKGWPNLEKYLGNYYEQEPEVASKLKEVYEEIKKILLDAFLLGKSFYKSANFDKDRNRQAKEFLDTDEGKQIKDILDNLENIANKKTKESGEPRLARKIDWEKFTKVIKLALFDIETENKNSKII